MSDIEEPAAPLVEWPPKFRPGDIIRKGIGSEKEVVACVPGDGLLIKNSYHVHDQKDFELVYRPATREETEALRRVAKAAQRHNDARKAWANAAIVDNVYAGLCEEVSAASTELVESLTALHGEVGK